MGSAVSDHLKVIAGKNLRDAPRKLVGKEPAIVTDHHFLLRARHGICVPIIRRGLRDALDVGEMKSSAITARQPSVPNLIWPFKVVSNSNSFGM